LERFMNLSFSVHGLKTGLITPGDDIGERIVRAATAGETRILDGDIIAVAESAVATAEGAIVRLETVNPSPRARELAERYQMDPAVAEVVLGESDEIIGGIPGFCFVSGGSLLRMPG
jgi:F420-0:gamma-glutamyl ligase